MFVLLVIPLMIVGNTYRVGLLLDSEDTEEADAIKNLAEYTVSTNKLSNIELVFKYHDTNYLNIFNSICSLLDLDVVAVISASDSTLTEVQENVLSQFHVPLISAIATNPFSSSTSAQASGFKLRLTPSDIYQSQAIFDILKQYGWSQFSIIASADTYGINGVVYLQYLASQDRNFNIKDVQHFDTEKNLDAPATVKLFSEELTLIRDSLAKVIVLNCAVHFAKRIFKEAYDLKLFDKSFVWITTDAITSRPELLAYESSFPTFYEGIIGISSYYGKGTDDYNQLKNKYIFDKKRGADIMMSSVRVMEGLHLISIALTVLDAGGNWDDSPNVQCSDTAIWGGASQLFSQLEKLFDEKHFETFSPVVPTYDIMNFRSETFEKIGMWSNITGLQDKQGQNVDWRERKDVIYIGSQLVPPTGFGNSLTGFHLKVGIVPEPPIAFLSSDCDIDKDTSSPSCWYGWNPDFLIKLSKDLNFTYEYVMPKDRKYGGLNKETKTWNGMMKDLLDRKTDLTIALSINRERSEYIDFTTSFFEDQASFIVYTKPAKSSTNMFYFMTPFDYSVWLTIILLIVVMAALTSCLSKLSPYSSYGKTIHAMQTCECGECESRRDVKKINKCKFGDIMTHDCCMDAIKDDRGSATLTFFNTLWLVGTGFVLQGTNVLPKSLSARFLLFSWWFFIMILTSMYTANLTAHLTLERSSIVVKNLDDLLQLSHEYTWGLITDRNLESMMLNHERDKYNTIAQKAEKLQNLEEGIEKVKDQKGHFIFIDESSVLTYNFRDVCEASRIDTGKFNNHWAFGIQVNSPYVSVIDQMFLQYREAGWFASKFDEWYKGGSLTLSCPATLGNDTKFDLPILSGLFCILAGGVIISFIFLFFEIIHISIKDYGSKGRSFRKSFSERLNLKIEEVKEEWLGLHERTKGQSDKITTSSVVVMNNSSSCRNNSSGCAYRHEVEC